MSVEIDIVYEGQLHTTATHGPSGSKISTDAPKDNMGKGEAFSPTDLVAAALGTCLVTIMGIVAQRNNLDITGTRVHVTKDMAQAPLRRIARLNVTITVPKDKSAKLTQEDRQKMEKAAATCPVHASLHPDIEKTVTYVYA